MEIDRNEIQRILKWAEGCDGESYIGDDDWPLIERLAAAVGDEPEKWAPDHGRDRSSRALGLDDALGAFSDQHGRWPSVDEQTVIRRALGIA